MDAQAVVEVFLIVENRLLREALIRILAKECDIRIVGAAPYSLDSHDQIISAHPSIVVLDSTDRIFETTLSANLRAAIPGVRIVLVDMELDERTFLKAVSQGVVGYILKDASASEVSATIRAVFAGEAVCPPALSMTLFNVVQRCQLPAVTSRVLSRREEELALAEPWKRW